MAVSHIALTDSARRRLLSRLHAPTARLREVDVDEAGGASATSAPPHVSDASSLAAAPVQLARMLAAWESSRLSLLLPQEATTPGTDARMVRAVCARELEEWHARYGWVQVQITEVAASPAHRSPSDNPTVQVQMTLARVTSKTPTDVAPSLPCGEMVLLLLPANATAGMLEMGAQLLLPACFWHTSAWPSTAARPAMPWPVICAALAIRLGDGAGSPDEQRGEPKTEEPTDTPGHPAPAPPRCTGGHAHVHDWADLSGRLSLTQPYVSVRGRPRRRLPHGNAILVQDVVTPRFACIVTHLPEAVMAELAWDRVHTFEHVSLTHVDDEPPSSTADERIAWVLRANPDTRVCLLDSHELQRM